MHLGYEIYSNFLTSAFLTSGRKKFYVCQYDFDNMVKSKDEECQYCEYFA